MNGEAARAGGVSESGKGQFTEALLAEWRTHMITAADLAVMEFPPRPAYIEGILIAGFGIFGGKPKLGKSAWQLAAAVAVASGGVAFDNPARRVSPARVLYLALEDSKQRLQHRISRLLSPGERWPDTLTVTTKWPRLDQGGLDLLAAVIDSDGYQVVVIDTLAKVRRARSGSGDAYQQDADALSGLHDLARERPGLALQVVHHNRKDDSPDDYVDALSGTTGISGVVDHIAVLQRGRGQADATLRFTSRDAPETDVAFAFDRGLWTELGSAAEYELSKARKAVYEAVVALGEAPLSDIAAEVGKDASLTRRMLLGLADDGWVRQDAPRGPWKPGPNRPESPNDFGPDRPNGPVSEEQALANVIKAFPGSEVVTE